MTASKLVTAWFALMLAAGACGSQAAVKDEENALPS